MLDTSGAIVGSLIVLLLFWKLGLEFRTIILLAAGISIFSLLPLMKVKEPKIPKIHKSIFKGVSELSKKLKYFIFVTAIFTLGNFGLYMFMILTARDITGSIIIAIALGVLFNFIWAFFAIPFGNLSDSIGRKKVLMMGYILFFIVSLGFVYLSGIYSLVFLFVLYGLVYAITQANQRAFVADLCDGMKRNRSRIFPIRIGDGSNNWRYHCRSLI